MDGNQEQRGDVADQMTAFGGNAGVALHCAIPNSAAAALKVQRISAENTFLRYPTDPAWVFGYDAVTVPLGA